MKKQLITTVAGGLLIPTAIAEKIEELEVSVVVADKTSTQLKKVNGQVAVKTVKDVEKLNPFSYSDLLADIPGVNFEGGPILTGEQITVRGQGGNAVTVRIDGSKQNFVSGHSGQRFFLDTELLRSVEVLKGGASNLYGSGSAGVLALETFSAKDFLTLDSPSINTGGRLRAAYNSVNGETVGSIIGAAGNEKWNILVGAVYRDANDTKLGNGIDLAGSALTRKNYLIKSNYRLNKDFEVNLGYQRYISTDQNGANPQASAGLSNSLVDREIIFDQVNWGFHFNPSNRKWLNLKGNLFFNRTNQERVYRSTPPSSNAGRINEHILESVGFDAYNSSMFQAWNAEHELIVGFEYIDDQQMGKESRSTFFVPGTSGTSSGRPDAEQQNFAIYVRDKMQWQNGLSFAAGFRYDHFSTEKRVGTNADQSDSQFSPKVELRYDVDKTISVFANYGYSFNAPTLNQLYSDGSHFGVVPTFGAMGFSGYFEDRFAANENLKAEKSRDLELGIDINNESDFGTWSAKLSYFNKKGRDTIDSTTSPPSVSPVFPGFPPFGAGSLLTTTTTFVNRSNTTIDGWEGQVGFTSERWTANAGFHIINGVNDDDGSFLNSIPGNMLYFDVAYDINKDVTVSWNSQFVGSRTNKVSDTNSQTAGYSVHGINLQWRATENFTLTTGVQNLFDEEYQHSNINRTEAGRNFYIGGSLTF